MRNGFRLLTLVRKRLALFSHCHLFEQAALADHDGRLTGKDAVAFFEKSGLPREILAKVLPSVN